MGVFMLCFPLNFLDRQLLAALAPTLKAEFRLSNTEYGELVSAFYFVYAAAAPLTGLFIDRVGLRIGAAAAAIVWSVSGAATGLTGSFRGLLLCRMGLGLGESAGIPLVAKASATYLDRAEMGLAAGFGAVSISLGSMAAPLMVAAIAPVWGWRSVFVLSGLLGLVWAPVWLLASRRIPPLAEAAARPRTPVRQLLRDPRLWAVAVAYCLIYTSYMLWANWTTIYLVEERHLTEVEANARYAWFPPAFSVLGGFLGGGLAFRWIRRGSDALPARLRACRYTAPLLLLGALIPLMPSAALAAAAIAAGYLSFQSLLGNLSIMPVDLYGERSAGFSNSLLACLSAATQVLAAPAIGAVADRLGFGLLCVGAALLPLAGLALLHPILKRPDPRAAPGGGWPARAR